MVQNVKVWCFFYGTELFLCFEFASSTFDWFGNEVVCRVARIAGDRAVDRVFLEEEE